MTHILDKLKGGDLRSIGKAEAVVDEVLNHPELFADLFSGLLNEAALIRMRSADALEKITRIHPEFLAPYKKILLDQVLSIEQQEVKWHVALMIPRLEYDQLEKEKIVKTLTFWLENDKSRIVRVNSLQALAELAESDNELRSIIMTKLKEIVEKNDSPAMVSRGKKLLRRLSKK